MAGAYHQKVGRWISGGINAGLTLGFFFGIASAMAAPPAIALIPLVFGVAFATGVNMLFGAAIGGALGLVAGAVRFSPVFHHPNTVKAETRDLEALHKMIDNSIAREPARMPGQGTFAARVPHRASGSFLQSELDRRASLTQDTVQR